MKHLVQAAMILTFVFMFAASSMAEWDVCGVQRIGAEGADANLLKVTNCELSKGGNDGKWLYIKNQKDVSMATLLTAFSMSKKVKLNADFANANTTGSKRGAVEVIYVNE